MSQNFYFEPPSRIQLVDKMAHLLRYSDFLVVIAGPKGSGKTSVAQRLALVTDASDICQIVVSLDSEIGALALALQCAKLVSDEFVNGMDPLAILYEKSQALHDVDQHLLIVIDNAEWLNDEAIELLAGLLVSGVGKPKIVLSGEEALVDRLNSLSLYELLEGRLHLEHLQPFTEDEAKEFLALRFSSQQDLNKRDLKNIFEAASGYPGRLTSAASALYRSGTMVGQSTRLPLPMPHIVGIGMVVLGVLFISVWQAFQVEEADVQPQIIADRVSVALNVPLDSSQSQITSPEPVNVEQSDLSKLLEEQERLLRQELALPLPVVTSNSREQPVDEPNTPIPTPIPTPVPKPEPKPEPKPKPKVERVVAKPVVEKVVAKLAPAPKPTPKPVTKAKQPSVLGAEKWLKEKQLLSWPSSGYTLQVLGARSEDSIVQFMQSLENPDRLYYFSTVFKNAPWHVVVYGQYATHKAANRAVGSLPAELQKLKPWARSIDGVQQDIKKK